MNMNTRLIEKKTGSIFSVMGNPFRIRLLLAIGNGEACVCHLESMLKKRQAFISQHLMALREAGLLETRREGKFIYYRLASPEIIHLIKDAADLAGVDPAGIIGQNEPGYLTQCVCPHCAGKEVESGEAPKIIVDAASIT